MLLILVTAIACTTREPTHAQSAQAVESADEPITRDQRVELELARVPDAVARPVIAELGLAASGLIAARHRIDPGWHIYWRNPGSSGLPTRLTSTPSEGSTLELGPAIYPAPDRFDDSFGWADEAIVFVPILAGEGGLTIVSKWVACQSDACVSGENQATLAPARESDDDAVLRAMLDRIPRPLGDRLARHAWSRSDDRVTLELGLTGDARSIELFPDASDPGLFFQATRHDPEQRTLTIEWRPGSPGHALPSSQGVLAWTDDAGTRYHELSLPWPE
jgi:DsbC/DsbD-like thiol-disulfide interchange protein